MRGIAVSRFSLMSQRASELVVAAFGDEHFRICRFLLLRLNMSLSYEPGVCFSSWGGQRKDWRWVTGAEAGRLPLLRGEKVTPQNTLSLTGWPMRDVGAHRDWQPPSSCPDANSCRCVPTQQPTVCSAVCLLLWGLIVIPRDSAEWWKELESPKWKQLKWCNMK